MNWYETLGVVASVLTIAEFTLRLFGMLSVLQLMKVVWVRLCDVSNNKDLLSESSKSKASWLLAEVDSESQLSVARHNERDDTADASNSPDYPVVEVPIGTLRSNIANYSVNYEICKFRGKLIAEVLLENGHGSNWQKLYERPDGRYLVYVERDHRHDYWISYLAGAMVGGESEHPLSLSEVQNSFPELATKAALSRVNYVE